MSEEHWDPNIFSEQKEEPLPAEPPEQEAVHEEPAVEEPLHETYRADGPLVHTKMLFLKVILPLWIVSHLIALMSGYMIFSFRLYGAASIVLHSLIAVGAGVLVYGMFVQQSWARVYGIIYSAFIVLNAWANMMINYIKYFNVIVFTDIITDVLLLFIFTITAISLYKNKDYFSGRGTVFQKESSTAKRATHIATCAILAFGLAVYFYFVWIRL